MLARLAANLRKLRNRRKLRTFCQTAQRTVSGELLIVFRFLASNLTGDNGFPGTPKKIRNLIMWKFLAPILPVTLFGPKA